MELNKTIEILEALAAGCSPKTGEIVDENSVINEPDVVRALHVAINELKKKKPKKVTDNDEKKNLHKQVDFFRREKFNQMTDEIIDHLKKQVKAIGISKTENLSEYIISARINYPRAYEPWLNPEIELFNQALKYTNDLDLLCECFQRGKGSLESYGQKLIYESQNP
ncbi:hypothetical protein E6C50_08520 [Flavobacterium supellecticarium]|uniref:Uncharacterized protein n=1 Tax=Flavobacterium supellecticarium TaxID=2565924 RepID=A0A4S4A1I4_9FLAO|nr:hypothetical protein [Flavobacterium supellecticarium]THF51789.1 hypothetical protein E6C50_08520 [Flavobacterium supellecticarium]